MISRDAELPRWVSWLRPIWVHLVYLFFSFKGLNYIRGNKMFHSFLSGGSSKSITHL